MAVLDARDALRGAGLACTELIPIVGGWASWTFEVDGRWTVRFPRTAEVANGHERERLLPELAAHVTFAVPRPEFRGVYRGLPFDAYEKLPGEPLTARDLAPAEAAGLLELACTQRGTSRDVDRAQ
jgi:aminoglycoside 2''-phosphotransferase